MFGNLDPKEKKILLIAVGGVLVFLIAVAIFGRKATGTAADPSLSPATADGSASGTDSGARDSYTIYNTPGPGAPPTSSPPPPLSAPPPVPTGPTGPASPYPGATPPLPVAPGAPYAPGSPPPSSWPRSPAQPVGNLGMHPVPSTFPLR